jgi:hypothetical protein
MKTRAHLFFIALVALPLCSGAFAQEPKNASLIMLDAQISAANGHYKTVLESIADRTTAAALAKDKAEKERIKSDLATLTAEKKSTEEQIKALVGKYNAALKKN